jgi:hypothetical protein
MEISQNLQFYLFASKYKTTIYNKQPINIIFSLWYKL